MNYLFLLVKRLLGGWLIVSSKINKNIQLVLIKTFCKKIYTYMYILIILYSFMQSIVTHLNNYFYEV